MTPTPPSFLLWLKHQVWVECHCVFQNTQDRVQHHPLQDIEKLATYASRKTQPWPLWLLREDLPSKPLAPKQCFGIRLLFPQTSNPKHLSSLLAHFAAWMREKPHHYALIQMDPPKRHTVIALLRALQKTYPTLASASCLEIPLLSPYPFATPKGWEGAIDAKTFANTLISRLLRLFAVSPERGKQYKKEALHAWKGIRLYPWFCKHIHHPDDSAFYQGTFILEGHIAPILPLLAMATHLNCGARLSKGYGAIDLQPITSYLDQTLATEEHWFSIWEKLRDFFPHLPHDLPEGFFATFCQSLTTISPPHPHRTLLMALGIYPLVATVLAKRHPELGKAWTSTYPSIPANPAFFTALHELAPHVDTMFHAIVDHLDENQDKITAFLTPKKEREEPLYNEEIEEDIADTNPPLRRPCFIFRPNAAIGLNNDTIYSRYDGETTNHIPLGHVSMLILQHAGSVTLPLLKRCLDRQIPVVFTSASGSFRSMLFPESQAFRTRYDTQLRHWDSLLDEGRVRIGVFFLMAKIANFLAWFAEEGVASAILKAGKKAIANLSKTSDRDTAMGFEGNFAKRAFPIINGFLNNKKLASPKREPHKRPDIWNCLLDVASSFVYNRLCILLSGEGLSPYRGFMHCQHTRYATLAADIQELFRARTESWLVSILNTKRFDPQLIEYQEETKTYSCSRDAWPLLLALFEEELHVCRPTDTLPWITLMENQIHSLRLWCMGDGDLLLYRTGEWWNPENKK
ncbi:MAG: CRISPR-associated endonuclease Cas1 [Desulfovibrio sp.]|nr:CRISPR-associated endonuclease Cas1 [Desulfovibrio sp.]